MYILIFRKTDSEKFHDYLSNLDDSSISIMFIYYIVEKEVFNSVSSQIQECMSDDDVSHTTNELLSHVGFDICNSYSEELLNNPQVTLADNSDDSFIPFQSNTSLHSIQADRIDPIWKECFLSVCRSYKGQFGVYLICFIIIDRCVCHGINLKDFIKQISF